MMINNNPPPLDVTGWSDDQWFDHNCDKVNAERWFAHMRLPFLYWQNRRPVFDGDDFSLVDVSKAVSAKVYPPGMSPKKGKK